MEKRVLEAISELLLHHECVIVPGLGGFVTNYRPAQVHPVLNNFVPPSKDILFNKELSNNDGLLINHLSVSANVSWTEASAMVLAFVDSCFDILGRHENVEIQKVGILFMGREGNLQFEPGRTFNFFLESYGLPEFVSPSIRREGSRQRIERKLAENKVFRGERSKKTGKALIRAAIISIPAAAVVVWGVFNVGVLTQAYNEFSGYFPWSNSGPEKHIIQAKSENSTTDKTIFLNIMDTSDFFVLKKNPGVHTNDIIYPSLTGRVDSAACFSASVNDVQSTGTKSPDGISAFIISGCFRELSNAERQLAELRTRGYQGSGMFGPDKIGMYKVYVAVYSTTEEANQQLAKVRMEDYPNAWITKY